MIKINGLLAIFGIVLGTINLSSYAAEGLKLPQTRVIYHAGEKSTTAGIQNLSKKPFLVKTEVLNDINQDEQKKQVVPFVVTPPLFRLEPESQYMVRILAQGAIDLPTDRESVFYLSFLAIPSIPQPEQKEESAVTAQVSVGMQTLIKLFYRPAELPINVSDAQSKLKFRSTRDGVVMENPTPYYLTLNSLLLKGKRIDLTQSGPMIAPFEKKTYLINGGDKSVQYTVINDYGAVSKPYLQTISTQKEMP